jgi:hypothetical protein
LKKIPRSKSRLQHAERHAPTVARCSTCELDTPPPPPPIHPYQERAGQAYGSQAVCGARRDFTTSGFANVGAGPLRKRAGPAS